MSEGAKRIQEAFAATGGPPAAAGILETRLLTKQTPTRLHPNRPTNRPTPPNVPDQQAHG